MRQDIPDPWATAMTKANVLGRSGRPSYRAITDRTGLSQETVRRLFLGMGESGPDTMRRVAEVLGVDATDVARWNGRARQTVAPYAPPTEADLLDTRQRRVLDELIRVMARSSAEAAETGGIGPVLREVTFEPVTSTGHRPDLVLRAQHDDGTEWTAVIELKQTDGVQQSVAISQLADQLRAAGFAVEGRAGIGKARARRFAASSDVDPLPIAARAGQPEHALGDDTP